MRSLDKGLTNLLEQYEGLTPTNIPIHSVLYLIRKKTLLSRIKNVLITLHILAMKELLTRCVTENVFSTENEFFSTFQSIILLKLC